eukprot:9376361-Pyramimonas_sp.AAC.1
MYRKVSAKHCPPLIKDKWSSCGTSKTAKGEIFGLYLACGGGVGKMAAIEEMARTSGRMSGDRAR